jgi:prepilin-type N-terminal cleavage/methylation domain-containing protein
MLSALRRVIGRTSARDDSGFTLIELIISIGIFAIFLGIVLTSVISLTKTSTKIQVTAQSASGELAVFQRLDRQIRYADSINFPGVGATTGDTYVEFRTPASSSPTNATLCTQWRFDPTAHVIQSRTWTDTTGATLGPWETDLTNVANDGGASYPFLLTPASNGGSTYQQHTLTLDVGNTAVKGASVSTTYVARNSSISSPSNTDDSVVGVSDIPICTGGTRS